MVSKVAIVTLPCLHRKSISKLLKIKVMIQEPNAYISHRSVEACAV